MVSIDFFFGTGSRYSYLAAARVPGLEQETGVCVRWRAVYSPELIRRAGNEAFSGPSPNGQYAPAYRRLDVARWTSLLGVPYREPDLVGTDWRRLALWAVAADLVGGGARFGAALMRRSFGEGSPPDSPTALAALAVESGLPAAELAGLVSDGRAEAEHAHNLDDALTAGAFGVPSFVTGDGALFFGQDRLPLLVHHLLNGPTA